MNFEAMDAELKATEDKLEHFRFILDELIEKHNELQAM